MTTAPERPAIEDVQHPQWCDLTTCETNHNAPGLRPEALHHSRGTMWPSQADGCENTIRLVHSDDVYLDGRNYGHTRVQLLIQQTETVNPDGSAIRADTWLEPEDARMLAAALTRYADLADRENNAGDNPRYPATEIRAWSA